MAQEKNFENKIKAYLKNRNAYFIKYWAGAKFTKSGVPDILICDKGSFIAIEVKAQNGKPSLLQLVNLEKIREAGGYGLLLYPQDFMGFTTFMENRHPKHDFYHYNIEKQNQWMKKLKEEASNDRRI